MTNNLTPVYVGLLLFLSACEPQTPATSDPAAASQVSVEAPAPTDTSAAVPDQRLRNADTEPANWLSHGRTYDEQRFSPLAQINTDNVEQLGLAWYLDLETKRGLEATPLVIDGVMYTTGAWSFVYAINAATGELLWKHDPEVPRAKGMDACCDVVNRGPAVWGDKVYVGVLDGRLIALDRNSGELQWSVQTTPSTGRYTITGAPRVANGKIIIGNGGAEFDARGFVTAYDAETGQQVWRFYTVPGDPSQPFESPELENAAKTWTGEWWKYGGGGTVWDSIVFDPELNLVYLGVGNGTPWNQRIRSPKGGDNLFLTAIVAVNADTGAYVWHYQTVPGETWDFTATQPMMLADLEIDGHVRKVIMQAPKNGFFYVLDRASGELISAEPFVPVNWATHIDRKTGRPVETANARYPDGPVTIYPSAAGAHNWHPMAFDRNSGLVFIPTQELPWTYQDAENFEFGPVGNNLGIDPLAASMPDDPAIQMDVINNVVKGYLQAWDPVQQRQVWRADLPVAWNGGVVATAGNLVFQGTSHGEFVAYQADTGAKLWSQDAQTGVLAGPITYSVDGEQYVAVMAGWGTAFGLESGIVAKVAGVRNVSRVLVYKLNGSARLPPLPPLPSIPEPPASTASAQVVSAGRLLYHTFCSRCHGDGGVSPGVLPDLRYLDAKSHAEWDAVVLGGSRTNQGMVGFSPTLSKADSDAIHAYAIKRAHDPEPQLPKLR